MLILCAIVTAVGVTVAVAAMTHGLVIPEWAAAALVGLVLPIIAGAVVIRWLFWRHIVNGVEVTAEQLPELHAVYCDLVQRIGLAHHPRLFVLNGNGTLNAFAAKCQLRRGYVVISSDLLELAYEQDDWPGLAFMLAHELGHIRCGHVALWRAAIRSLPRIIGLDRSLTRAQEYSADRCAAWLVPEGTRAMFALYAGKRLHRRIDPQAYLRAVDAVGDGMWLTLVNLWSTHPVGWRRMQVLARVDVEGWDVHGRMR
jgi:Zn-dependent protease with chaperone function